mmetsp:Transcript_9136/g.27434  ORF Transcript_9136/g.27434 Transcript_9136/m.27434 type:complete len:149 (-) Transcript_9136:1833-2279(-)
MYLFHFNGATTVQSVRIMTLQNKSMHPGLMTSMASTLMRLKLCWCMTLLILRVLANRAEKERPNPHSMSHGLAMQHMSRVFDSAPMRSIEQVFSLKESDIMPLMRTNAPKRITNKNIGWLETITGLDLDLQVHQAKYATVDAPMPYMT